MMFKWVRTEVHVLGGKEISAGEIPQHESPLADEVGTLPCALALEGPCNHTPWGAMGGIVRLRGPRQRHLRPDFCAPHTGGGHGAGAAAEAPEAPHEGHGSPGGHPCRLPLPSPPDRPSFSPLFLPHATPTHAAPVVRRCVAPQVEAAAGATSEVRGDSSRREEQDVEGEDGGYAEGDEDGDDDGGGMDVDEEGEGGEGGDMQAA